MTTRAGARNRGPAAAAARSEGAAGGRAKSVGKDRAPALRAKALKREKERGRQTLRQWRVLRAIEASRRGLTVQDLLSQLELDCHARTVKRDLATLETAGFVFEGAQRRWRVARNDALTSLHLPVTTSHAVALLVALRHVAPLSGAVADSLADLRDRVTALLAPKGRRFAADLARAVVVSRRAAFSVPNETVAREISRAVEHEQHLRIVHKTPGKTARERVVLPLGLAHASGGAYLIARCKESGERRTFALTRIEHADMLDETFEPSAEDDPAELVGSRFGIFGGPRHRFEIDFLPEVAHVPFERELHPTQRIVKTAGGGARVTFEASGLPEVAAWLAGFGGKAIPAAPRELVEAVRELHRAGIEAADGAQGSEKAGVPGEWTPDVQGVGDGGGDGK